MATCDMAKNACNSKFTNHMSKVITMVAVHLLLLNIHFLYNRARKSRVNLAWRYEIHAIIGSLGTVRDQPRFWSHVKSMGDFRLLQITVI